MLTKYEPRSLLKNFVFQKLVGTSHYTVSEYMAVHKLQELSLEKKRNIVPVLFRTRPYACYLERNKIYRNRNRGRDVVTELSETELRFYYLFAKKLSLIKISETVASNSGQDTDSVFEDVYRFFFQMTAKRVCFATVPGK